MRASRLVSAPNWRYAVGEVVLIVVAVTIALAATSWYEGRQERRDEILILQQLRQTLSEDLQEINMTWESTRQREQNLTDLLNHLESDSPYTAELGVKFQALLGWRVVEQRHVQRSSSLVELVVAARHRAQRRADGRGGDAPGLQVVEAEAPGINIGAPAQRHRVSRRNLPMGGAGVNRDQQCTGHDTAPVRGG